MADSPDTPAIEYPALYTFRFVGKRSDTLRDDVRLAVQSVVGHIADDSVTEHPSKAGNYVAVHVVCLLRTEQQRRDVYSKVKENPAIVLSL